jgi:membrane protein
MTSPLPRRPHWRRYTYALTVRARRIGSTTKQAAWRGLVSIYNSDDLTHAASIAYYSLLSFFPFLLLLISVLGAITSRPEVRLATLNFVLRYFPAKLDFVASQLQALQRTRLTLGVFGIVALTWASLGFFSAISTAVNHAWKVERQRSYLKHKFVAFLMMATACLLLILTVFVFSASQVVGASWFGSVADRFPRLLSLRGGSVNWAATLSLILGVGLIFYFVPNAKVRFRDVWVGAVLTGLLWRAAFAGFSYYVRDMSRYSIHGSIGAVVVFLVWVYISAVILLYGVEFTAAYSRLLRNRADEAPAAPPRVPSPAT